MAWYFVLDGEDRVAIGGGGFKGVPSDGEVEVGYSIVPRFQRQGFASEGVSALIAWAFAHDGVERIVAQTLPESTASQGLLRKLGFHPTAPVEPGVLRFQISRDEGG